MLREIRASGTHAVIAGVGVSRVCRDDVAHPTEQASRADPQPRRDDPEPNVLVSMSLMAFLPFPKRRFPLPTTGWTMSRYSSMRSWRVSVRTRSPLP